MSSLSEWWLYARGGWRYRTGMAKPTITDLDALDLRIATVVRAEPNLTARDPALRLWLDTGAGEPVQSSAKLTERYGPEDLVGRQVVVVCAFAPIRVGGFRSDVLVLGAITGEGVVLLAPDIEVPPGSRIA